MQILRSHDGAKDDSANVFVWIWEGQKEPTVDHVPLGKWNDSGTYGSATENVISAGISRAEASRQGKNSEALDKTDTLSADDACNNVETSRFILQVSYMVSRMKNNRTDAATRMYSEGYFRNELLENMKALLVPKRHALSVKKDTYNHQVR